MLSEAFFVCIHHKYAGRCQPRLITVHKGAQNRHVTCITEGALGGPYLMSERKGTSRATDSARDTAGLLMCCNKAAGGLLVRA